MSEPTQAFDQWAVVDVMGHQRYAGRVTEQVIAGAGFIRVDVPETKGGPGFTKLFGPGAIHSITICTEASARTVADLIFVPPIVEFDIHGDRWCLTQAADEDDPF